MTRYKAKFTPSPENLVEIFGSPGASERTIRHWKLSWRDTKGKLEVESLFGAQKIMQDNNVDPLFYQTYVDQETEKCYVIFFNEEDEVFFKLHPDFC